MKILNSESLQAKISRISESLIHKKEHLNVYNLTGSARALFIALLSEKVTERVVVVVTKSERQARELLQDIQFYRTALGLKSKKELFYLPEGDEPSALGIRLKNLYEAKEGDLVVLTIKTLLMETYTREELSERVISLYPSLEVSRPELVEALQKAGYRRVSVVAEPGGFSYRRWIIDVFPANQSSPVRIEFFGDTIDSIKAFDIESQVSTEELKSVEIYPAINKDQGQQIGTYFTDNGVFINLLIEEPLPEDYPGLQVHELRIDSGDALNMPVKSIEGLGISWRERKELNDIGKKTKDLIKDHQVVFVALTPSQADRIKEILLEADIIAPVIPAEKLPFYDGKVAITTGTLSEGLQLDGLVFVTSTDLFGKGPEYKTTRVTGLRKILERLDEIEPGDYVVHKKHGIGIFRGLKLMGPKESESEVVEIEYAGGTRIYLPVQSISLIHKYRAEEGAVPTLDRPGSRSWQRKKSRIQKRIHEMAKKLVRLYAHREVVKGFAFSPETELHREFESFFPFELTPDQARTWEEVKKDMESQRPMDRLVCGDVGFGKTEIAMRAAFKAVYDGKQVAVLVPTTLLCEQHYRTFSARFSAFPVRVDYLSRFKTPSEVRNTLKALKEGEIDIIIGTHALLGKRVEFFDLGLLIVDEEHRFGVTHKERIKELKKRIDCLTLSATPIPRTLEMSLSGIRDMSLIETPPEERIAVKGIVTVFNEQVIADAIRQELSRGGQVFFVHNRVKELPYYERLLKRVAPGARIATAHGQMPKGELEKVMHRFVNREIDILLCTSIIGSGLDLPSVNTIIINRADMMGLAELYQLKGRVGRGSEAAYAYFLIPPVNSLTEEARRRIKAIEELNYLGAGLRVAMRDLEIRGAGNLLGKEQSGHIHEIGLDLYLEMLSKEISELKGMPQEEEVEPVIDVNVPAYIPEDYVEDTGTRLSIYRRLSLSRSDKDISEMEHELKDRFGEPPREVKNLLDVMSIKVMAREIKAERIAQTEGGLRFYLTPETPLTPECILALSEAHKGTSIRMQPDGFTVKLTTSEGVLDALKQVSSFFKTNYKKF